MSIPEKLTEVELWPNARDIVHFVGPNAAGKTTLANRMALRVAGFGAKVTGTTDYDPHTPDNQRQRDRAFSRELDLLNNASGRCDPAIHQRIVDHSLAMIASWMQSDANLVLVDRFHDSYDDLPSEHVQYIETALRSSGFRVHHVLLVVADSVYGQSVEMIRQRLLHAKGHRPDEWWENGPPLDQWAREEANYQDMYRLFCHRSPFPTIPICTLDMQWERYEKSIADALIQQRWLEAYDATSSAHRGRVEGVPESGNPLEPQECTFAQFKQIAAGRQYGPFEGEQARTMVWFRGSVLSTVNSLGEEALREAHRLAVQEALYMNSEASARDFFRKQARLPSKAALDEYPDLRVQFPIESVRVDSVRKSVG